MAKMMYQCRECEYKSSSWFGKCPECSAWDSFEKVEEVSVKSKTSVQNAEVIKLSSISSVSTNRKVTENFEFDRVLGGGFLSGEVILLAGEPGVGKSTLLLEVLQKLSVLYVSGEESATQMKHRAERLKVNTDSFYFSSNTQVESIIGASSESKTNLDVVVVDSIQMVYSPDVPGTPGGATQIREVTSQLVDFAKSANIPVILIGHITKEGNIAGPKTLEHLVDCVLYLEGERFSSFRILRANKNRFGTTDEIGVFEMNEDGLKEVKDPTQFLKTEGGATVGKAIVGVVEGSRSIFFEIQSLVVSSYLPSPRRVVSGLEYNKVLLLLAVLQKNLQLSLDKYDVYVSVAGGVSTKSTASDLGVASSIISSFKSIPISPKTSFTGEVSLLGEVRSVYQQKKVLSDAKRYGFSPIISSEIVKSIHELSMKLGK